MEKPVASGSSNVTVEYTDPSRVFSLIAHDLEKRLPLRNLHWNSSSRPLRSISSLHIELVPDSASVSQDTASSSVARGSVSVKPDGAGSDTAGASKSQPAASEEPKKERRHQIPGLRQTPYLKIYLLRCGDTDTYKAVWRKLIREWIKDHTSPSRSSTTTSKQENHDAFEWLIIHVVFPGDDASSSRLSGNTKSDSRWPTRSSSSVIEKIRADVNGTSKSAIDRATQIRATESLDDIKVSSRPTPYVDQSSGEDQRGWEEVITKLKFLILASFDLRVSQYEEDIREKESQRSLPGWNFNTFFVLKEGLARGFESVGLVEDALAGYHELAAGLNTVISERDTSDSPEQHTDIFCDHTEDVFEEFKKAIFGFMKPKASHQPKQISSRSHDFGASFLDTDRKPFRELILANNISAFDFQCYVFARQVSLLLRLANMVSIEHSYGINPATNGTAKERNVASVAEQISSNSESQNLLILADICWRSLEFITSAARALRDDFRSPSNHEMKELEDYSGLSQTQLENVIENLVTSWTFSASQCILDRTSVQSLSERLQPLLRQLKPKHQKSQNSNEKPGTSNDVVQRANLPDRTSSLPARTPPIKRPSSPEKFPSVTSLDAVRLLPPTSLQTGSHELAAQRADLLLVSRRAISSLGLRIYGWKSGWADIASVLLSHDGVMEDVSLDNDPKGNGHEKTTKMHSKDREYSTITGTHNNAMLSAISSRSNFYETYEDLTASALGHYVLGEKHKSAEGMIADIAAVRFLLEDYVAAASYFHQLAPFYAKNGWGRLEMSVLEMYAQCLKHMGRNEEYIDIAFRILAKTVQQTRTLPYQNVEDTNGHLGSLTAASKSLDKHVSIPMDGYFEDIRLDPYLYHHENYDGFQLSLQLRSLLPESLQAQKICVRLVTVEEPPYEIWLATEGVERIGPGSVKVLLKSKILFPAWCVLDQVMIQSENINFTHDLSPPPSGPFFASERDSTSLGSATASPARVLVWARSQALEARLSHCKSINLEQTRSLVMDISAGWNNISEGRIQLRAATAGLRLHTAEAKFQENDAKIVDQSQPGSIKFGEVSANTVLKLEIPYSLESDLKEIMVKIEVHYTTAEGDFTYASNLKISILLPVGVNVQDIFKEKALFSKFTISTADLTPLRISRCLLEGTKDFEVSTPPLADGELDVFATQPLSLVSKICRSAHTRPRTDTDGDRERKLLLRIGYCRVDQELTAAVERSFLAALADSPSQKFSQVLVSTLSAGLRARISSQDLEMISMIREINIGAFQDYGWDRTLSGLPPEHRHELADWLGNWHKENTTISIASDPKASITHYLTVPVEVPQMLVVHTVHLRLVGAQTESQAESGPVAVSHVVPAELTVKHTRRWGTLADGEDANRPLDFCYELQASPDSWLIGGQKKAHFSAREDESLSFPIILLPQRTGHLLLPSVDVRPSCPPGNNETDEKKRSSAIALSSCETDYRSQGETVLVIPDLSSTTVSLDPHGSTNGAWLVESKSRHGQEVTPATSWMPPNVVPDSTTRQQYNDFTGS